MAPGEASGPADGVTRAAFDPGSEEHFVSLRRALGVTSFGISQMNLRPGQRGRIHRHERQEEVYLVLEGELTVLIEGEERREVLGSGDLLRVGPEVRRQLVNLGPAAVRLIALGGYGEHASRDGEAFTDWSAETGAPPQQVPLPEDLPLS